VVRVNHKIKAGAFLFQPGKAIFHNAPLGGVQEFVHIFYPLMHTGEPYAERFMCYFLRGYAGRMFEQVPYAAFVLFGKILKIIHLKNRFGIVIVHFNEIPQKLNIVLKAVNPRVIGRAILNKLFFIKVPQMYRIILIRQIGHIAVLILAYHHLAPVPGIFNTLIIQLYMVKYRHQRVMRPAESAGTGIFQNRTFRDISADIRQIKTGGINLGEQRGYPLFINYSLVPPRSTLSIIGRQIRSLIRYFAAA